MCGTYLGGRERDGLQGESDRTYLSSKGLRVDVGFLAEEEVDQLVGIFEGYGDHEGCPSRCVLFG